MMKVLKINEELHKKIIDYCDQEGLLIYKFIEKIILEKFEKIEDEKNGKKR